MFGKQNRSEIDIIKGILIVSVVVGHNEAIAYNAPWLRKLLYYFHVQGFFLLSALLDTKPFSWPLIRDRGVRYVVPYAAFLTLCWTAFALMRGHADDSITSLVLGLVYADSSSIYAATGMRYLWFLPSLFVFVVLKSIAFRWPAIGKAIAVVAWCWMCSAALILARVPGEPPWGAASALFFFGLGQAGALTSRLFPVTSRPYRGLFLLVATVLLSAVVVFVPLGWVAAANVASYDIRQPLTWVVGVVYPWFFLALLDLFSSHASLWFHHTIRLTLDAFGKYSLPIYLIHMPVYRILTRAYFGNHFDSVDAVGPEFAVGMVILAATLAVSLAVAMALWRFRRVRGLLFPRDWQEWKAAVFLW